MARIYNSRNERQQQADLLSNNIYTIEQTEYKLRQKADKTTIYTKTQIDGLFTTTNTNITTLSNSLTELVSKLNNATNVPLKWNGTQFLTASSAISSDGISPLPIGWSSSSSTFESIYPILDSGEERSLTNSGVYLGRRSIIDCGSFNSESIANQQNFSLSPYAESVYPGSSLNWKQFEPNNRIIIKNSDASTNNGLGPNSLYTGELAININTGDIFIGWQNASQNEGNDVVLAGIKRLFSPSSYIRTTPNVSQLIQPNSSQNIPSLSLKGSSVTVSSESSRADIFQVFTRGGDKKVFITGDGTFNVNNLNISTTSSISLSALPTTAARIPIKVNGVNYFILAIPAT